MAGAVTIDKLTKSHRVTQKRLHNTFSAPRNTLY